MALRIFRDNRKLPPLVGLVTIFLLWCLIDPTVNRTRQQQQSLNFDGASSAGSPAGDRKHDNTQKTPSVFQGDSTLSHHGPGGAHEPLHRDEVLLILKTGATVLWKRLPVHLTTTLSGDRIAPENVVLYSEVDAKIGNWTVQDILKPSSESHRDAPEFELYRSLRAWDETNHYIEQTGLPGDDEGPPGGWRLDKYKFLPLVQHAGQNWPHVKWYLYTEDDTYMFLPNVLLYLSAYDHRESHWLGGLGEKLGTTFAHGGSGFALSRGAWEQSFGKGGDLAKKYQNFVDQACCGDYALGKVLNDYGVKFGEDHGETVKFWGFNGLPHWKIEFSTENWCLPVLTWHHAHNRDIARYYELEKSWDFSVRLETFFLLVERAPGIV